MTGRWDIFVRFMRNYEQVCLASGENTRLAIVLFEKRDSDASLIRDEKSGKFYPQSQMIRTIFYQLRKRYTLDATSLILVVNGSSEFSRSIGCELGAAQFSPHDLIFFVDVDITFTAQFLLRARLNTIEFKQVQHSIKKKYIYI